MKIQVNGISTTVTNNKTAADRAINGLRNDLNEEISDRQDLEDQYYGTWVYQNDRLLSLMAAQFNSDGTIKGYADLKIQVNNISSTVTSNKRAADNAITNINNDLDSLWDYAEDIDEKQTESATWISQNKNKWSAVAASFNSNGTINAYGRIALYVNDKFSTFEVDADRINFKTGTFKITNQQGITTFSIDGDGNMFLLGTVGTQLSYNTVKFLDDSYTIKLSRDHYSIYCLSGGGIGAEQEVTLPDASSCVGLLLTFFCEYKAHSRSWVEPKLKGLFYKPTDTNYGNTVTELVVETLKVYRLLSVGNFWAPL